MMKRRNTKIEITLVVLIALCMLLLINIVSNKMNEIIINNNSIILRENPDKYIDGLLAKELMKYKLEACTMVETYDKDFNLVIRIPLVDDQSGMVFPDLNNHINLKEVFKKYPEGHTQIQIGDHEEDVYFRWTKTSDSQPRLVLIYLSKTITKNLWMIPFLCYFMLFLIFILVIRLHLHCQEDRIDHYHKLSVNAQNRLLK